MSQKRRRNEGGNPSDIACSECDDVSAMLKMSKEEGIAATTTAATTMCFKPEDIGLPEDFILTDYTRLKGCSCKVPQARLLELLEAVSTTPGRTGNVGMDCSIVPVRTSQKEEKLFLVSTTDYFFPSVEDPYLQGQIGASNVLSDLYSMGIDQCDTMLMLLAASTDMDIDERYIVTKEMMKGYAERCGLASTNVTGGQTVMNPWPLIGGVAMSVVSESEMIRPTGLKVGDVMVLTKPLGCQLAVNCRQWLKRPSPIYVKRLEGNISDDEINELYMTAALNMARLNKNEATLMKKYRSHGATDVTGFGILGHAINLAEAQLDEKVCIELHTLPILKGAVKAEKLMGDASPYKLLQGLSAETSGGLLVSLESEKVAKEFIEELKSMDAGSDAWIVGSVKSRRASMATPHDFAHLSSDVTVLEV